MGNFIGFLLLWRILGNPVLAILVILLIVYLLDRRFIGLFPSFTRPFKRMRNISKLRTIISNSPSDVSSRHELARLLIERRKYKEALELLESIHASSEDSAEYWDDLGTCHLNTGNIPQGEQYILQALEMNPRVKYGRPYLRLAGANKTSDREKAISYVQQFQAAHSSSSEAYYLLGSMYKDLGRNEEAKQAFKESVEVYKSLPKYKKRQERKWAVRSLLKSTL
ncbi:tetratricopeptide repeat protein [Paenibacillus sp. N3/727]|uniref:tetratricopeptide repeat protein n=1 Tax=Paenibacillus sp. N3/727 TaxID=2925845 RepID=UPI001F53DA0E|nr:tetratricopeptide repeat protein [Paenibacillus sp. N3/727]UNK16763.1 tetratricopeptide repeat protein [Paenibacillus sp. N3/727]